MENTEQLDSIVPEKPRPDIISVLCVFVWIGNGLAIVFGILGLIFSRATQQPEAMQQLMAPAWTRNIGLLPPVLYIIGAIFMWKLRKSGFFIYMAGKLLKLFIIIVTAKYTNAIIQFSLSQQGVDLGFSLGPIVIVFQIIVWILFPILFLVAYKHLK